jgi:putative aldouronate transport system permease protein
MQHKKGMMISMRKDDKTKRIKKRRWSKDDTQLSLLALPTFVWFILFSYLPMFGVIIAFKQYKIVPGKSFLYNLLHSKWVGFDNFEYMIQSNSFLLLLRNTILYNIVFVILGILIPVTLAIMLSLIHGKTKSKIYQTAMFFPHFLSWVVVSYFVFAFLSADKGIMNSILQFFGLERIQWYMEAKYWPFILTFMKMWKGVGYGTVVYLACITGIDTTFYEAAVVDGATKWKQVKYITIPCLKPIIIMMFILSIGSIFSSDFGLFYQVTRGIPASLYNVASTVDTYIYNAIRSSTPIGMTSATSFLQSVACCGTILLANWIVKKIDDDYAII